MVESRVNGLTSSLRWLACGTLMLVWYPVLIGASYVLPMASLHRPARWIFRLSMRVLGLRLVVRGLEHIDCTRGHMYVGNHVNLFDPFVFVAATPQWVVAVEKHRNFRIPIYGWLLGGWGNLAIDRDDPTSAIRTLDEVAQRLSRGESICLMPEGTRTRDGELGEFKTGPFRAAIESKARIVPFALRNMRHFNRTGSFQVHACEVEVVFMPPIEAGDYDQLGLQALSDRVREQTIAALQPDAARMLAPCR